MMADDVIGKEHTYRDAKEEAMKVVLREGQDA